MHATEQEAIDSTPVGNWTYYGACANPEDFATFSVNIFQVITKAGGRGKKKSKGILRVAGRTGEREHVYTDAEAICVALNQCTPYIEDENAKTIARTVMSARRAERKAGKP